MPSLGSFEISTKSLPTLQVDVLVLEVRQREEAQAGRRRRVGDVVDAQALSVETYIFLPSA